MIYEPAPRNQCRQCGQFKPFTSAFFRQDKRGRVIRRCKACLKAYNKAYRSRHKIRLKIQRHEHYLAHKEVYARRHAVYQRTHRQQADARSKQWQLANPRYAVLRTERRRARKRNLPDTLTVAQWLECLRWFEDRCVYCGNPQGMFPGMEIVPDHFIALSSPECPGTTRRNIVPSCQSCNASKGNKPPLQWLVERFGKAKAQRIYNRIQEYFRQLKD